MGKKDDSPAAKRALLERLLREKAQRGAEHPLSTAQRRIWFIEQLDPGTAVHNLAAAVRIRGPVDSAALEAAFGDLAARQASLRTSFHLRDGAPVQRIHPRVALPLGQVEVDGPKDLPALLTKHARRPFALDEAPLAAALLIRLGPEEHVLALRMHHLISDGWSVGLLLEELVTIYQGRRRQLLAALPPLAVQYADYAVWERDKLASGAWENQVAFWRELLADPPEPLELPLDFPRPAINSSDGDRIEVRWERSFVDALHRVAQTHGASLYMTLLTAWYALLSRYSHQLDLCVGSPVAGRRRPELEPIVGCFVNVLVLRQRLDPRQSLVDLLTKVRDGALAALDHQDVPYEHLLDALDVPRDPGRNPLFQSLLVLQNAPLPAVKLDDVEIEMVEQPTGTAKFDLAASLEESASGIHGFLEYRRDLFQSETVAQFAADFRRVLEILVSEPTRRLDRLALAAPQQLPSQPPLLAGMPVQDVVAQRAARQPRDPAVIGEEGVLTFRELDQRSNQAARRLRRLGIGPEQIVAIQLRKTWRLPTLLLAVLKAGGAFLPLDRNYPPQRLAWMLEDARPVLLIHDGADDGADEEDSTPCRRIDADELLAEAESEDAGPLRLDCPPEQLAYVIFTSGSTGRPKGVAVTHRGVANFVENQRRMFQFGPGYRKLQFASISFDAVISEIFSTLSAGAAVVAAGDASLLPGEDLIRVMRRWEVDSVSLPPSALGVLDPEQVPGLRLVITAGEACPPAVAQRWAPRVRLINGYGPTENTVCISMATLAPGDEVTLGKPIAGVEAFVLSPDLEPTPRGVSGELVVGGIQLARGYLRQPHRTAEAFIPNPFSTQPGSRLYRTGDRVRIRRDGRLAFQGRVDRQVKIRGYRIELGEIESAMTEVPGVAEAAVVASPGASGARRIVAYVAPVGGVSLAADQLREALRARLPDYMLPAHVLVLEQLPKSPNGKIDRRQLPDPTPERPEMLAPYVAPRNDWEQRLADSWSAVLGVQPIGIHDNFFDLGGDSILGIQLVARLQQQGLRLTAVEMYQAQTIADQAAVAAGKADAPPASIDRPPVVGEIPLGPPQAWFFDQDFVDPHHWNQALLLALPPALSEAVSPEVVARALRGLVERHDLLRAAFSWHDGAWRQRIAPVGEIAISVPGHDLRHFSPAEQVQRQQQLLAAANGQFALASPPLLAAMLIERGDGLRLWMGGHHLVVDAVSWPILLEDFLAAMDLAQRGQTVSRSELPPVPATYADWTKAVRTAVADGRFRDSLDYWKQQLSAVRRLPTDASPAALSKPNDRESADEVLLRLGVAPSQRLQRLRTAADASLEDALLAAVARAIADEAAAAGDSISAVAVQVEGHGRDGVPDLNLVRTVGWFTTIFPLAIPVAEGNSWASLEAARVARRSVPTGGLSFGALKYFDEAVGAELRAAPMPEVAVNYVGQVASAAKRLPGVRLEDPGPVQSPRGQRGQSWEINAGFLDEQLEIRCTYSSRRHRRDTAERVAQTIEAFLLELADDPRLEPPPPPGTAAPGTPGLTTLRAAASGTPIVWFPPVDGALAHYLPLCRLLRLDWPMYGALSNLGDKEQLPESIGELADRAAEDILSLDRGLLWLGGWSMGAIVAYETARRLEKRGRDVRGIVAIDQAAVYQPSPPEEDLRVIREQLPGVELDASRLAALSPEELVAFLTEEVVRRQLLPPGLSAAETQRRLRVYLHHRRLMRTWRFDPSGAVRCPLCVAAAEGGAARLIEQLGADLGWQEFTRGPVAAVTAPGNHQTILRAPNVRRLAEAVRAWLESDAR